MLIATNGVLPVTINNPQQTVAFLSQGLSASVSGAGTATPSITFTEGFANSFKARDVSFTVGDYSGNPGNASFSGGSWNYNGGTSYPHDLAQNVPGVVFNTEDMFLWLNNTINAPPTPNPPPGYGATSVPNIGQPLNSAGAGGIDTKIRLAGIAMQGTRLMVRFHGLTGSATVTVPAVVHLYKQGCSISCTATGVMVLTATNPAGAGTYNPVVSTTLTPAHGFAVYEVLYADLFSSEYATVQASITGAASLGSITETVSFAPFYATAAANQPSLTLPVPRFVTTP